MTCYCWLYFWHTNTRSLCLFNQWGRFCTKEYVQGFAWKDWARNDAGEGKRLPCILWKLSSFHCRLIYISLFIDGGSRFYLCKRNSKQNQ
jgi:hypothetical protein